MVWMYLVVLFLLAVIGFTVNDTKQRVKSLQAEVERLKIVVLDDRK